MELPLRSRRTLHLPITLSVVLISLNIILMVCWIVLLASTYRWMAVFVGTLVFAVILVGLSFYMFLMIKEVRLNQRQANFVDSVTHELKSPIASLKLYLETLQLRELSIDQQKTFFETMQRELDRLDHLITQLLEVGRLDEIGQQAEPISIALDEMLKVWAESACAHHKRNVAETVEFDLQPATLVARPLVIETVFRNLLDNAIKYSAEKPHVIVQLRTNERGRIITRVTDNGPGIGVNDRKRIFQIFYRAGNELERRQKGTGLGLYIVQTLVRQLKGRIHCDAGPGGLGTTFEVELPTGTIQ